MVIIMNKKTKKSIKLKTMRYIKRVYIILILLLLSISISSAAQSPYSGTPRSIPGTIQAEDFDKGGEGTAYHDPDSVNQGGQYRLTEGVDIESTTDTGAGYNVGWIQSGEWIEYTTNVSTTGTYAIQTRVASNGNGGTFHIEFNGIDKTGQMTIPNTGGWQNWQTLSKTVTLNSGQQIMKIVMDTNGATGNVGNLNYIRIASSTSAPTPTQSPVVSGAFYVATNGNDANPGTESQPWRTIQKAANTLKAGQTVYVKQGTYKEQITVQNSGSADKWITFSSYPGQTATIDGTGISMGNPVDGGLFQIYGKSYIKVTGFKIINSGYAGFYVTKYGTTPSSNIIFSNNYLERTWAAAIIMMGLASTPATNFIVDGNTLVQSHYSDDAAAHEGISIGGNLEGFEVKNNVIRDSLHGAIDAKDGARNGKIYRNTCTRTTYSCVYVDGYTGGASNIDIFENVVHDMKSQNVDDVGSGFNIASEQGGIVEKINIYNNLAYNNPGIALIIPWYSTGTVRDIKITSNTFYNNGIGYQYRGGIALDYDKATGVVVRNNILSQNNQYQISSKDTAIIENNFIDGFRGYSTETRGTNYIEGNPQFINPANPDFHLKSISPAIDKGSSISIVNVDFDGKSRPSGSGYDIGAYEY